MTHTGAIRNTGFTRTQGEIRELTEREVLVQAVNLARNEEELAEASEELERFDQEQD